MSKPKDKNVKKISFPIKVESVLPKHRQDTLNPYGWGYSDCYFSYEDGRFTLKGSRYPICNMDMKDAPALFLKTLNFSIENYKPCHTSTQSESDYAPRVENPELLEKLKAAAIEFSVDFSDRLLRCRGQAAQDVYILRYGKFRRIPDLVVWPKCHDDVVLIVELANKFCSVIVPYGGGTNVTLSLSYNKTDGKRVVISLDTSMMNRILWIDDDSMLACIESGIAGGDLVRVLDDLGYVMGHEPDSLEFSTLGGWVATRSSGIMQQAYGNIEQMVSRITLVTSVGVMEKSYVVPRTSVGPDFDQLVIGSEGTLGVITNVVVKLHKKPEIRRYGAIFFPDFETGMKFMYDMSKIKNRPASLRLVDNVHFQFGRALNFNNLLGHYLDKVKVYSLSTLLRYDLEKVSIASYLIEGSKKDVQAIEADLKREAKKRSCVNVGPKYGIKAYSTTFFIGYSRDLYLNMGFIVETMEPSVAWSNCQSMMDAVGKAWDEEIQKRKIFGFIAKRFSQIYNDGACIYYYYGFKTTDDKDQLQTLAELSKVLHKTVLDAGGSLSHHHGVGKKNSDFYSTSVSRVGVDVFRAIKSKIDPNNVFDAGNFVEDNFGAKL